MSGRGFGSTFREHNVVSSGAPHAIQFTSLSVIVICRLRISHAQVHEVYDHQVARCMARHAMALYRRDDEH